MKKYFFYLALLFIALFYFITTAYTSKNEKSTKEPTPLKTTQIAPYPKGFLNCILNMGYYGRYQSDPEYPKSVENQIALGHYNELQFNALHIYSGANHHPSPSDPPAGYSSGGSFGDDSQPYSYEQYFNDLKDIVSSTIVSGAGISGIYGRAKIEMPCYFQKVVYEVKESSTSTRVNYGFCYDSIKPGTFENENGRTILHGTINNPGYLCQNIYENCLHSDILDDCGVWSDKIDWLIRPMMRIDSNYVDNCPESTIVRIDIIKYNGEPLKSVDIKAKDFARGRNSQTLEYIYNGSYIDSMNFFYEEYPPNLGFNGRDDATGLNQGWNINYAANSGHCNVDFKIYYYGNTDVWFDKLTVEDNEWTHKLFSGEYDYKITRETSTFSDDNMFSLFADEFSFASLRSLKYVRDKVSSASVNSNPRFYFAMTNYFSTMGLKNGDAFYQFMIDSIKPECFCVDAHTISGKVPYVFSNQTSPWDPPEKWESLSYEDYNLFIQNRVLGDRNSVTINNYNPENYHIPSQEGSLIYQVNKARTYANMCTPKSYLFVQPQIHAYLLLDNDDQYWCLREPTNEEISVQASCALAHGADGLSWFTYQSFELGPNDYYSGTGIYSRYLTVPYESGNRFYCAGLLGVGNNLSSSEPRIENYYGQNKWEYVCNMNQVLLNWKPTLDNTNWVEGYSVHSEGANHSFINNIRSIFRDYNKQFIDGPNCENCDDTKYWEMGFFTPVNTSDKSKYVLMVNRRCSPEINETGDVRALYLKFNAAGLPDYNNWKIVDVNTGETFATFNKNLTSEYIYAGVFQPGEGKLLKIVPVMQEGGTLACIEEFNTDVTLKKSVYNNGFNITMGANTNITFADSAGIYMTGGDLTIGSETGDGPSNNLYFQGVGGNAKWQGFILENCGIIKVFGAHFNNIMPNQSAINIINCYHYKIENNIFTCADGENSNGVNVTYYTTTGDGPITYHYIKNNTFTFSGNPNPAVQVISNAGTTTPVIIESNTFNTGTSSSTTGILLTGVSGGVIRQNGITNYNYSISLLSSSCDFFYNTISNSLSDSKGIQLILSTFSLNPSNGYFTGGYNNIFTSASNSVNIDVENSYFDIDNGYNTFNIDFSNSQRHITGYFPSSASTRYNARYNCFENNSAVDTASVYVTKSNGGSRITFTTSPAYCGDNDFSGYEVFSLAGGINDTIYMRSGGNGGGESNDKLQMLNVKLEKQHSNYFEKSIYYTHTIYDLLFSIFAFSTSALADNFPFSQSFQNVTGYKVLKDSININIRKNYYNLSELECKEMLLNYPDSSESIGAISKLYLSSLTLDSAGNHIQATKTFFETLILNNPNNTPLIKRANYFVQKCKARLKQYSSALQGFQEIINQNPYSYEGLIASWDYAATTLLANSGGALNDDNLLENVNSKTSNVKEIENEDISLFTSHVSQSIGEMLDSLKTKKITVNSYSTENYDTKKFTKKDREVINTNVTNAFTDERTKQIEKLKELEKQITTLSNSTSTSKSEAKKNETKINEAKKELKTMKALGEVVKVKKPKDIKEHINFINADIKKVFGTDKISGSKNINISIPTEYSLSQNYPNPFNPVTKINYELPKDGRVKLVIYDILGREIKSLVNNEFKQAGRYTVEFNGTQFASGIYFYRIQVEDGKSFTQVKKMVMIK